MASQIVFFGSSEYSVFALDRLITNNYQPITVVTTPDKPVGRHLKLTPNPVKVLAQKNHILVIETFADLISNLKFQISNSEVVGLVAAFGKIIPQNILDTFNTHIYNIHPSLLPKYRGPSPLQQQILDGIKDTGVTIIQLDNQMDHGPIVARQSDQISDADTPLTLGPRLFLKGTDLFIKMLPSLKLREGSGVSYKIQDDTQSTYTHKLTRQSGFIPWSEFNQQLETNNQQLITKFRAFSPWPGIWSLDPAGRRIKLISLNPPKTITSKLCRQGQFSPLPHL